MSTQTGDTLSRTTKILIDRDNKSIIQAESQAAGLVLQIDVDNSAFQSPTLSAALLTTVNAGARAFEGGVHVKFGGDVVIANGWESGQLMSVAAERYGGSLRDKLSAAYPTIAFGASKRVTGSVVVNATWSGWSGGVVDDTSKRLDERQGNTLSAVLAGAVAVSECFQNAIGDIVAARRDTGLSLWSLDSDWLSLESFGPELRFLPANVWLVGLGHLGQAYCWLLGSLHYAVTNQPRVVLQDVDRLVMGNHSTSLLALRSDIEAAPLKTRLISNRLEGRGFSTSIIERAFDTDTRRQRSEPAIVLAGLDNHAARRALSTAGFERIIDAGLGSRHDRYLDILVHSLGNGFDADSVFPEPAMPVEDHLPSRYEEEVARRVAAECMSEEVARCGVVELAGKSVGAAFVGATAAALVIAEAIRPLHGGHSYSLASVNLSHLKGLRFSTDPIDRRLARVGFIRNSR